MTLFYNQYRIESPRWKDWDYSDPGWYFITICIKNKTCCLSNIRDNLVVLTQIGIIVNTQWQITAALRHNIELGEYVIMPNHFHGLLRIKSSGDAPAQCKWKSGSLGAVLGRFKSATTRLVRQEGFPDFAWQPGFYDRVVLSPRDLYFVQQYIIDNPLHWGTDRQVIETRIR